MLRMTLALGAFAALLGAGGVALAAYASHAAGGELARTAAQFLMLHGAALLGVVGAARAANAAVARALLLAGAGLGLGTLVFAADLQARAFGGDRLFAMAAPLGGSLMILGWLALAAAFVYGVVRAPKP